MKTVPLRRLAQGGGLFTDGDWIESPYITDSGVRLVQTGNIGTGSYREQGGRFVSEETFRQLRCTEVVPGDILICRLAYPVGRACLAPDLGVKTITSVDVAILRPRDGVIDPRFINYWFASIPHLELAESMARGGTRQRISREQLGEMPVPQTPLGEQRAIADYLDSETARIDALITKKRRVIELLEERRAALSLDMIKGSGLAGPRKLSGVSWIGSVPEAWDVAPVSTRFEVVLGRMLNAERETGGEQFPYLRNINIRWDRVDVTDLATMDFPAAERRKYALRAGDLMVCEGGAGFARAAVWDGFIEHLFYQKSLHRVRPRGEWPVEWLGEWLRAGKHTGAFEADGNLSTIPHLTAEQLRAHRVPMPSPPDCRSFLTELAARARRDSETLTVLARQLNLLSEHRQALITAAVTGELEIPVAA